MWLFEAQCTVRLSTMPPCSLWFLISPALAKSGTKIVGRLQQLPQSCRWASITSVRNRILFGFHVLKTRLAGKDCACVNYLCEVLDRELSKPFFMNVILQASSYSVSLWMLKQHIHLEGGDLRNTPEIIWVDNRLHVLPGVSRTDGGRLYFGDH